MKFNINDKVKVKLNDMGRAIHRVNHYKLYEAWPQGSLPKYTAPVEEEGGWSKWQLWELMREFGNHFYNGAELPFDPEIEIVEEQQ